jgi:hypothetical protein
MSWSFLVWTITIQHPGGIMSGTLNLMAVAVCSTIWHLKSWVPSVRYSVSTLALSIPSPLALTVSPALAERGSTVVTLCPERSCQEPESRKQRDASEKSHLYSPPFSPETNCTPFSG